MPVKPSRGPATACGGCDVGRGGTPTTEEGRRRSGDPADHDRPPRQGRLEDVGEARVVGGIGDEPPVGALVKVRPGQAPEVVLDGLNFPTGLTIRAGSPTSLTAASAPVGAGCCGSRSDLPAVIQCAPGPPPA